MTRSRLMAAALIVSLLALLTGPAGAAEPDDPEAARDDARNKQAALAGDLDLLRASEAELLAAARAHAIEVAGQQRRLAASERAVEEAEAAVREAEAALARTRARIARLTDRLVERAVNSFIAPERSSLHDVAVSANFTDAVRKQAFIAQVIADEAAVVVELDRAREQLEVSEGAAEAAQTAAARRRAENEERLSSLERAAAEQDRVRGAIEARQRDVVAEIDALAAEEAGLTALIERRAREQREAAERAAAAAAQARAEAEARERAAAEQAAAQRAVAEQAARERAAAEAETRERAAAEAETRERAAAEQRAAADQAANQRSSSDEPEKGPGRPEPSSATGAGGCIWPTRGVVTSEYGSRWGRLHAGIDIAAPIGTPIYAARSGSVLVAGYQGGYGLAVVLDHGDMITLYGHQSRIGVDVGEGVGQGQLIGYVGSTGHSTGPHLHFETRHGGSPKDPRPCLP